MYCNNCGNANAEGRFCDICGSELVSEYGDTELLTEDPVVVQTNNVVSSAPKGASDPGKVLGMIGMILGIAGTVFSVFCCTYSIFCATPFVIAALILSAIGSKKSKAAGFKNAMAKVGLILSIISLVIIGCWLVYYIIALVIGFGAGLAEGFGGYNYYY